MKRRRLALLGTSRATLATFTSSLRAILQEQGRTSVIWPESQLCVGFGVTSQMPGRGGELANVLQDLELKKCFHQFLRGNAEAFDGPVEGGPCRPVPRAGERKQPFQYALAQSRDLL